MCIDIPQPHTSTTDHSTAQYSTFPFPALSIFPFLTTVPKDRINDSCTLKFLFSFYTGVKFDTEFIKFLSSSTPNLRSLLRIQKMLGVKKRN